MHVFECISTSKFLLCICLWEALSRVQYCNCFEFSDGINLTCDYFCLTFSWSILILFIHLCLWISEHVEDATLYHDAASI